MSAAIYTFGKCRCCQAEGEHRYVMKEYYCKGTREVYFDMFLECFNVFLSTLYDTANLICTQCIQQLRDANAFRKMVINAEKRLQAASKENEFVAVKDNPPEIQEIKEEIIDVKMEPYDLTEQNFMDTDNADFGSEVNESEDRRRLESDEARLLARFAPDSLRLLPTRDALYELCPKYVMHLDLLQGKKTQTKDIQALIDQDTDHDSDEPKIKRLRRKQYITDKYAHVTNAAAILENSNVTAFKGKSRTGLPCFYCKEICDDIVTLRTHQESHSKTEIAKSLKSHSVDCLVINVDITDLKCTLCNLSIASLKELKNHLISTHKKKIYTELEDRIVPFKMPLDNNYLCLFCGFKYETFGSIERHMNGHFRNYVCDECGTGFVTNYRMKMHAKTMHVGGSFKCEICEKVFSSYQKHKSHVDFVHKCIKRFKCPKCNERFTDYFKRRHHLVAEHGLPELEYKCNVCDKVYTRKYMLSRHMKRDHLEERYFQCDVCFHRFFAKRDLESHMVKHNGARIFECTVCKKSYARKKTLTEHMRIHNNDRRFSCAVCGQAFVQNCSLKGHIKTHHPEFVGYGDNK